MAKRKRPVRALFVRYDPFNLENNHMKIYNIDLHISVIEDIKSILTELGHTVDSTCMSGHTWVFGRPQGATDVVSAVNWRQISPAMCSAFYARYKDELAGYDAFLTTHLPCLSWLFRDFPQPTYVVCSTRYEAPFNMSAGLWDEFDRYLREGVDSGKVILLANNRYDAKYVEHFTGCPVHHIPSLCEYVDAAYAPVDQRFLLYGVNPLPGMPSGLVPKAQALSPGHHWRDVAKFRGIVAIPYNVSTMSFFEFYEMGIPLFVPTERFMLELKSAHPGQVLNQVAWDQVGGMAAERPVRPGAAPNAHTSGAWADWLALADFYDRKWMPHILYFDSWEDLRRLLGAATGEDLLEVSRRMLAHGEWRRRQVHAAWSAQLAPVNGLSRVANKS